MGGIVIKCPLHAVIYRLVTEKLGVSTFLIIPQPPDEMAIFLFAPVP